jgi:AraC-like DNA-binding protein
VSNALPFSMSNLSVPAARRPPEPPPSQTRMHLLEGDLQPPPLPRLPPLRLTPAPPRPTPLPPPPPVTLAERMDAARERIRVAAQTGLRIRSYEVALDLDLSEFHFARQFRAAFGRSPHVFYDECRADRARSFLAGGMSESDVARKVGFRRPAELRSLLKKCLVG